MNYFKNRRSCSLNWSGFLTTRTHKNGTKNEQTVFEKK
ncbi:hypothetical protein LEP1GSC108_3498 [Leptospira weilii str. UI 13098]|uniref:Uncharacterized protein n=1 Tax=Leptospira weilii str. UI 13098 TaxID=1088542 RepID=M6QGD1_9LEPT|nr:hypothetical protein LEP1GSC108_3498 [Leptospira weilii str. UI 13098]